MACSWLTLAVHPLGNSNLLDVLRYNSTNDLIIHLGDVTAKGPHSTELVARFAEEGVLGVRGNNDQKVIGELEFLVSPFLPT